MSPGGSSGGEGALVAMKGSIIGIVSMFAVAEEIENLILILILSNRERTLGK